MEKTFCKDGNRCAYAKPEISQSSCGKRSRREKLQETLYRLLYAAKVVSAASCDIGR